MDKTKLSLIINDGVNKFKKPAIIWQIYIFSYVRMNKDNVLSWLNNAHNITSSLFKSILQEDESLPGILARKSEYVDFP